jgi:hypothetical protein
MSPSTVLRRSTKPARPAEANPREPESGSDRRTVGHGPESLERNGSAVEVASGPRTRGGGGTVAVRTPTVTPRSLARLHDHYISAIWRGDDVADVTNWLEARWNEHGAPEPDGVPDAASLFGGGGCGHGIRWYRRQDSILGYPTGTRRGCYRIVVSDIPPRVPESLAGDDSFGSSHRHRPDCEV